MTGPILVGVVALAAVSVSAAPFRYVSFAELKKAADLVRANELKALLIASFGSENNLGWSLKDMSGDGLLAFNRLREDFYQALLAAAKADPADAELKALADWGYRTYVKLDPSIELRSERLLCSQDYESLRLK